MIIKYDDNGPVFPRPKRVTKQPTSQLDRLARLVPKGPDRDRMLADTFDSAYEQLSENEQAEIMYMLNKFMKIRGMGEQTAKSILLLLVGIEAGL